MTQIIKLQSTLILTDSFQDDLSDVTQTDISFSALMLKVGWQEGHPAWRKTWCWFVGGGGEWV